MGTKNILVKKLVLELFSAVCVYSGCGHRATLDALDYYKVPFQLKRIFKTMQFTIFHRCLEAVYTGVLFWWTS